MGTVWSLRGKDGFERVRAGGRSARGAHVAVRLLSTGEDVPVRLGMAVGKPVGCAVQRNLVRRRLRSIVGEVSVPLHGTMVVIRAFPGVADVAFGDLRSSVRQALGSLVPLGAP